MPDSGTHQRHRALDNTKTVPVDQAQWPVSRGCRQIGKRQPGRWSALPLQLLKSPSGHFSHVEVALGIGSHQVRRLELADPGTGASPMSRRLAVLVELHDLGAFAIRDKHRPRWIERNAERRIAAGPGVEQLAVAVENLNT